MFRGLKIEQVSCICTGYWDHNQDSHMKHFTDANSEVISLISQIFIAFQLKILVENGTLILSHPQGEGHRGHTI